MIKKTKSISRILTNFLQNEYIGGIAMLLATLIAMIAANSTISEWYQGFVTASVSIGYGEATASAPLTIWVQDILMVFFFLLVGLELKREMLEGFLAEKKQILLPMMAALSGMAVPSLVFLLINRDIPYHWNGWAIPSATDIAFALCILMLAGKSIPPALKIFLLAIAIFDDIGAIIIIALFYNSELVLQPLMLAVGGIGGLIVLNRLKVMKIAPYMLVGAYLCYFLHASGIHTTIAGVLVGMAIPLRDKHDSSNSPLNSCMHFLHPWVSFLVLPVFAFTSAGVNLQEITLASLTDPLVVGIAAGLFFGKQIGIFGISWLMIKWGRIPCPEGANWRQIYAVSVIAGIGFTMSLFIGMLAFDDSAIHDQMKLGVIIGSLLSAVWGWIILRYDHTVRRRG